MFLDSFRHLIEIQALKQKNQQNAAAITSENKRISDLEERRKRVLSDNENYKIEEKNLKLVDSQNKIEDLQNRLTKLNSQLTMATSLPQEIAFKNQIHTIELEIKNLEDLYFLNLEKSDEILNIIKENIIFHNGSEKTLEEIRSEAKTVIASEEIIIKDRNKRIDALLEQCHPSMKSLYLDLEKKFAPKIPVSYLIDKKCNSCHMSLDSNLKSTIEEGRVLECCSNCGRLIIPETAKIY
jgi:predicted  nucleic acid-binding Zn-ribbon protein